MRTANLLLSAAIAALALAGPASVGSANAGKIKIQVSAAKAANAKVKPRIRIKPKITVAKAATKVKVKRKKKLGNKINPAPKPAEEARIASAGGGKKNSRLATGTSRGQSRYVELPEITDVLPTFLIDFSAGQHAAEAARSAAELKDMIELGALREAASPDFGLPMPDLVRDIPSNAERLGDPGFERRTGGMFPGDDLGSGPGGFGTLSNSHNRKTPNNPWGVNTANIADGIAGKGSGKAEPTEPAPSGGKPFGSGKGDQTVNWSYAGDSYGNPGEPDTHTLNIVTKDRHGTHTINTTYDGNWQRTHQVETITTPGGLAREIHRDFAGGTWSIQDFGRDGNSTRYREGSLNDGSYPYINQLRDPDYVGGSNCRDIGCIVNGEGGLKPLDRSKLTAARVLPAGPDEDNGGISASGTPMYSANDVLERYDEDNRRRDQFRPANSDDFCFHSEC